jgi:glycosyltransferase involved in cell wall biosynthesis
MRILQVITPSKIAGAERSTASLCEHLVRAGHRVTITCKRGHALNDLLRAVPLDVRPLPISGKANVAAAFRLARLARSVGAEVIHTQLSTAALWGAVAGRLAGVPSVAHVRALNSKVCYLLADRVVAVSEAVRRHLIGQGMEGDRIDVVYSGVDARRFANPPAKAEARRALGLPEGGLIVGVLAHLSKKKGHAVFLEAFRRAARAYPEAIAVFAGDGRSRERLQQRALDLGLHEKVVLLGYCEDVLPVYSALDLLVLPSVRGEGLPRVLLEAGFLGLPAIGSDLSGVPEIIRDGETGYVVRPGDPDAMAARIEALLADGAARERLGNAARDWIRTRFTVEAMVEGTVRSYRAAGVGRA